MSRKEPSYHNILFHFFLKYEYCKVLQRQEWQLQQQPKNTEAKQRREQILPDMVANTRLIKSISQSIGMHIHSSTKVSLRNHPYNNFLVWIIILFNQEDC